MTSTNSRQHTTDTMLSAQIGDCTAWCASSGGARQIALAAPSGTSQRCSGLRSFRRGICALTPRRRRPRTVPTTTIYRVIDRLHEERTVHVPGHEIASVVAAWLAELGVDSPLVEDLARAVHV